METVQGAVSGEHFKSWLPSALIGHHDHRGNKMGTKRPVSDDSRYPPKKRALLEHKAKIMQECTNTGFRPAEVNTSYENHYRAEYLPKTKQNFNQENYTRPRSDSLQSNVSLKSDNSDVVNSQCQDDVGYLFQPMFDHHTPERNPPKNLNTLIVKPLFQSVERDKIDSQEASKVNEEKNNFTVHGVETLVKKREISNIDISQSVMYGSHEGEKHSDDNGCYDNRTENTYMGPMVSLIHRFNAEKPNKSIQNQSKNEQLQNQSSGQVHSQTENTSVLNENWTALSTFRSHDHLLAHGTSTSGHMTSTTGHVSSTPGHVSSTSGNVTSTTGHVISTPGHVISTSGHVTSTTGNVTSGGGPMSVDIDVEVFKCKICNKTIRQRGHFLVHLKSHEEENCKCRMCGTEHQSLDKLHLHMTTAHKGDNPYKCEHCSREFSQYNNLRRHLRVHRGKVYKCELCDREFNEEFYLTMHMGTHTGKRVYSCGVCNACFGSSHDLKMHVKTHSPSQLHTCNVCGKSFSKACVLRQHKKGHSGDRPHKCDKCPKTFIHRHHLTMHMRSHSDNKPYTCDICKKEFYQSSHLYKHLRCHDNENEEPAVSAMREKLNKVTKHTDKHVPRNNKQLSSITEKNTVNNDLQYERSRSMQVEPVKERSVFISERSRSEHSESVKDKPQYSQDRDLEGDRSHSGPTRSVSDDRVLKPVSMSETNIYHSRTPVTSNQVRPAPIGQPNGLAAGFAPTVYGMSPFPSPAYNPMYMAYAAQVRAYYNNIYMMNYMSHNASQHPATPVSQKNSSHMTQQIASNHMTQQNGGNHMTQQNGGSHMTQQNTDSHMTQQNTDSHMTASGNRYGLSQREESIKTSMTNIRELPGNRRDSLNQSLNNSRAKPEKGRSKQDDQTRTEVAKELVKLFVGNGIDNEMKTMSELYSGRSSYHVDENRSSSFTKCISDVIDKTVKVQKRQTDSRCLSQQTDFKHVPYTTITEKDSQLLKKHMYIKNLKEPSQSTEREVLSPGFQNFEPHSRTLDLSDKQTQIQTLDLSDKQTPIPTLNLSDKQTQIQTLNLSDKQTQIQTLNLSDKQTQIQTLNLSDKQTHVMTTSSPGLVTQDGVLNLSQKRCTEPSLTFTDHVTQSQGIQSTMTRSPHVWNSPVYSFPQYSRQEYCTSPRGVQPSVSQSLRSPNPFEIVQKTGGNSSVFDVKNLLKVSRESPKKCHASSHDHKRYNLNHDERNTGKVRRRHLSETVGDGFDQTRIENVTKGENLIESGEMATKHVVEAATPGDFTSERSSAWNDVGNKSEGIPRVETVIRHVENVTKDIVPCNNSCECLNRSDTTVREGRVEENAVNEKYSGEDRLEDDRAGSEGRVEENAVNEKYSGDKLEEESDYIQTLRRKICEIKGQIQFEKEKNASTDVQSSDTSNKTGVQEVIDTPTCEVGSDCKKMGNYYDDSLDEKRLEIDLDDSGVKRLEIDLDDSDVKRLEIDLDDSCGKRLEIDLDDSEEKATEAFTSVDNDMNIDIDYENELNETKDEDVKEETDDVLREGVTVEGDSLKDMGEVDEDSQEMDNTEVSEAHSEMEMIVDETSACVRDTTDNTHVYKYEEEKVLDLRSETSLTCGLCWRRFYTKTELEEHQVEHARELSTSNTCSHCHKVFTRPFDLQCHIIKLHSDRTNDVLKENLKNKIVNKLDSQERREKGSHSLSPSVPMDLVMDTGYQPVVKETENRPGIKETEYQPVVKETEYQSGVKETWYQPVVKETEYRPGVKETENQPGVLELGYQCGFCDSWFPAFSDYQTHVQTHTGDKPYVCSVCHRGFAHKHNLNRHKMSHNSKSFQCDICQRTFKENFYLQMHMKIHSEENTRTCEICGQQVPKSEIWRHTSRHLGNIVENPTYEQIGHRVQEILREQNMNKDIESTGMKSLTEQIGKANKGNGSLDQLAKLMKLSDNVFDKEVTENIENFESITPKGLQSALNVRNGANGNHLKEISSSFENQKILDTFENSDMQLHQCHICKLAFKTKREFVNHLGVHNGTRAHVCKICGKGFKKKSVLRTHEKIHNGDKLFKCADCSATFLHFHQLQVHVKVHNSVIHNKGENLVPSC